LTCCSTDEVFLSYLPLAHIFDRVAEETMLSIGGRIGYWQGNPKLLLDDVGALKPTIFVGVPRIFDRIYNAVNAKVTLMPSVGSSQPLIATLDMFEI
jgi:long-chain acyl-CoA synthetase